MPLPHAGAARAPTAARTLKALRLHLVLLCSAATVATPTSAPAAPAPASPALGGTVAAMAEAARKFLQALSPGQKSRAQHAFDDGDRQSIKYIPLARTGVPLKALDTAQRQLAHALLKTGLAQAGYDKATKIMELDLVLAELERNPVRRDPENYYFWVFGDPVVGASGKGAGKPWGWKVEGHHISLNFTIVDGALVAATPSFFGANPAEVRTGPMTGRRVLHAEEDLARELVLSFPEKQRAQVIFDAKAPPDIVTADHPIAAPLPEVGVLVSAMTPAQKELLRRLLAEYAGALPAPLATARLGAVDRAGFDKLRFGWAGGTERGRPLYYRVAGPTFVLEYDNTQDNANHAHTVWRDFAGDFGRDLLHEHLKEAHND